LAYNAKDTIMRMVFGLAGILVVIGVIVIIMRSVELPSMQQAAHVQKEVKPQVQQIAGQDVDGTDARKTIKLDSETSGGQMTSVLVTDITPGGAMENYFGLKKDDSITAISMGGGVMRPVKEMGSPSEAKDALLSAMQQGQQVEVVRDGKKLTLPTNPGLGPKYGAAAAAKPTGAAPGAAPAPAAKPAEGNGGAGSNPLQRQLDAIQKVPGQ
jgi:hypothetical protein